MISIGSARLLCIVTTVNMGDVSRTGFQAPIASGGGTEGGSASGPHKAPRHDACRRGERIESRASLLYIAIDVAVCVEVP